MSSTGSNGGGMSFSPHDLFEFDLDRPAQGRKRHIVHTALEWILGAVADPLHLKKTVTAQVGDLVQDRRRDFAKDVGSPVRASMMAQPCFLAVEKNERISAKSTAPSTERKPPEIFWRNFIMRPSRSA